MMIIIFLNHTQGNVRWFTWAEVAFQLERKLDASIVVVNHVDDFAVDIRATLRAILDTSMNELLLELALIDDAARRLCVLCYTLEGDGFLAPTAYSDWMGAIEHGRRVTGRVIAPVAPPIAPKVRACALRLSPGNVIQEQNYFEQTVLKAQAPYDKLEEDTAGRLSNSIAIYRACALLDYANIASSPLATWPATLVTLARLPYVHDYLPALQNEMAAYHSAAVAQLAINRTPTPADRWEFWRERALILPFWFKAALEVAIVFTSSGCVERIFSLYDSLFGASQESALEDVREASVMMRFNANQRRRPQ
jgi:hypothetical protein